RKNRSCVVHLLSESGSERILLLGWVLLKRTRCLYYWPSAQFKLLRSGTEIYPHGLIVWLTTRKHPFGVILWVLPCELSRQTKFQAWFLARCFAECFSRIVAGREIECGCLFLFSLHRAHGPLEIVDDHE